jgi:23S rRNA (cytosine1962-C5)-methyltransferase
MNGTADYLAPLGKALEKFGNQIACVKTEELESFRVFHGRGHCFPGLESINVDYHPGILLVTRYRELPEPDSAWLLSLLEDVSVRFNLDAVILQSRDIKGAPYEIIHGALPKKVFALQDGLKFHLDFSSNQNAGYFLDMTPGHRWVGERSSGKRVLNLFAYTGAFSVYASHGGADKIVNIDISRSSLNRAWLNHKLNELPAGHTSFLPHNIFKSIAKLEKLGPYDLVIADPPTRQKGSFVVEKDYPRLLRQFRRLLCPGAELLLALNSPDHDSNFLKEIARDSMPDLHFQERLQNRGDFPELEPERSLKMLVYQYQHQP